MAKNEKVVLDDREQYYSPYTSDCANCVHFDRINMTCPGFPKGIPLSVLGGEKKHREVWSTQKAKITFKPK